MVQVEDALQELEGNDGSEKRDILTAEKEKDE